MKKRNKILIRLLTAILCVSFLPITVMADNDPADPDNQFAAWTMNGEEESDCTVFWVEKNSTKELSVSVSADDMSGISYQWLYFKENDEGGYTETTIDGATGSTYEAGPMNRRTIYMCDVTDSISATTQRVTFYINIINLHSVSFNGYDGEFIDVTVPKGETKTFKVNVIADDTDGLVYKWYWNDVLIEGATTDTYTTDPINECDVLSCMVNDKFDNYLSVRATIYYDNQLKAWPADSEDDEVDYIFYSVSPNEKKLLEVNASASDPSGISYEWYKWTLVGENSSVRTKLEGKTGPSLTTDEIKVGESYSCLVYDQLSGQNLYVDFYFNIENHFSICLEGYEKQTDYDFDVAPGETRTLSIVTEGDDLEDIVYMWYWGGDPNDPVQGATSGTFTTPAIESSTYAQCIVKDKYDNTRCITVYFTVDNEFYAWKATGDDDIIVSLGDDAELEVEVSAIDTSLITYQWFRDLNDGTSYEDHPIEGATDAKYAVESVTATSTYACEVTDGTTGERWVLYFTVKIDNQFRVTDKETNSCYIDKRVPVGQTKTLSVKAYGDDLDGVTFSWYVNGELAEGTSDTFVSPTVSEGEYMYVKCVACDKYGNTDQVEYSLFGTNYFEAWVTTTSQTRYKPFGKGMGVQPGSFVTLSVSSEWESDLTYEWTISDGYYCSPSGYGFENTRVIPEATGDTIVVGPINTFTEVDCKLTNEFGGSTTVEFYIWVSNPEFELSTLPDKIDGYVKLYPELGADEDIYAFGIGSDTDFQRVWYKNDEVIQGADDGKYTIENIQSSDTYCCFAHDRYNNYSHVTYEVIVHDDFRAWAEDSGIYERKEWAYFVQEGQDPVLSVSTNAEEGSPVSYQWFYMDEDDAEETLCPDTVNAPAYTIKISEGAAAHDYYLCKVTDQYNNSRWVIFTHQAEAYAWMLFEEDTEADCCDVCVDCGKSLTLEVVTTSVDDDKFSFEWYLGGVYDECKIAGATSSVYYIANVMGNYTYFCVVKYDGEELRTLEFNVNCRGAWITGTDCETSDFFDVKRGETATLSVTVDDLLGSPSYQWYVYESDALGYGEYVPIQGANSATYETEPVTKDFDLRCEVSDDDGYAYSVNFWIYVDNSEVEAAKLLASSLTLDGYLKVNFKFDLPDELANDAGSYILINDTKCLVSDADRKDGYYYFTYSVASSEIQKAIVLQAFSSNGAVYPLATKTGIDYTDGYTYSITQYLKTVMGMSDAQLSAYTNKPSELRALVTRLGEFGTLSQAYFKDNRSCGYISDDELKQVDDIHAATLADYQATVTKSANNKIKYTGNLSLETATHLNHYFTLEDGRSIDEYEIYVNDQPITTESTGAITLKLVSGNKYCLKIDDIAAPDLDVGYNITVKEKLSGETLISVEEFSALSYVYLYLNLYENDASKANIVRVLKSLYLYNKAANGYFG